MNVHTLTPPTPRRPLVLVPACNRELGGHPFSIAGHKYTDAVRLAGCLPVIVPGHAADLLDDYLAWADGVLLTGSPSNVHPRHFDQTVHNPALPLDPARDDFTLALIPRALARGLPLLAICRGFQEVNVALGGSLHQAVQDQPGLMDHRGAQGQEDAPPQAVYAPAHPITLTRGGLLQRVLQQDQITVNSVHGQGVQRLAPGLQALAHAPDGLIEAFTAPQAPGFNLCLQWHPEWQAAHNPDALLILQAFGQACQAFHNRRSPPDPEP